MTGVEATNYSAIGKINPHEFEDPIGTLFRELQSAFSIKLATLWKINSFSGVVFPIQRVGHEPDVKSSTEFFHPLEGSFIGEVLREIRVGSVNFWHTEDVQSCKLFRFHLSPKRVKELDLRKMYCVSFRNFHAHNLSDSFAGILNIYVHDDVDLADDFLNFLSSRLSDIYSTSFIIQKDKISDAMLDIFRVGVTKDTARQMLDRVLREVCGPMLMAEGATIYEWDAHRFCFAPSATTGFIDRITSIEPNRHGLIDYVASSVKPLLLSDLLDPQQVSRETGQSFDDATLRETLEETRSQPRSCLIIPILNPAQANGNKPVAVLKLLNKKPKLGNRAVYFDYDDIVLAEEVGRVLTLYEEQVRLSQSREAFALLFGHEAQAPASGIRGTADRILWRTKKDQLDKNQLISLVQDIFDFSELIVSFAESLTFGFKGQSDLKFSRFNPRHVNLSKSIEAAKRVVIPICRYEKLQYDSIKIVGPFPDLFLDQRAMMQVFYNFFTNAIKYRRRGDQDDFSVSVRAIFREGVAIPTAFLNYPNQSAKPTVRVTGIFIEIADFGMGIESKYDRQIFSEGFRTPEVGKLEIRGSGIGLSVVKNIVMAAGGHVWLARHKDPTTFVLFFPSNISTRRASDAHYRLRD